MATCVKGNIIRKGYTYTRRDGKRVTVPPSCIQRGKGTQKKSIYNIKVKKGTLTNYGYHAKLSQADRRKALDRAVRGHAKKKRMQYAPVSLSLSKKLILLGTWNKRTNPEITRRARADAKWLKNKYYY